DVELALAVEHPGDRRLADARTRGYVGDGDRHASPSGAVGMGSRTSRAAVRLRARGLRFVRGLRFARARGLGFVRVAPVAEAVPLAESTGGEPGASITVR